MTEEFGGNVPCFPARMLPTTPRVAGRFGVGFSYEIPRTRFSLFSQGTGWVYNLDNRPGLFRERESRIGVNGRQFDIAWTGGISYRLPF